MIDRIRHDIQQRLDQLLAEADKLRRALAALDPRERAAPKRKRLGRNRPRSGLRRRRRLQSSPHADPNTDCQDDEPRKRVDANGAR